MSPKPDDTCPEDERAHIEAIRQMPIRQRAEEWNRLNMAHRERILDDVRKRYPQADEQEIRTRFAARVLPRELVIRMFGGDPEKGDD
jgi:hypothetical protein